jgi:hypothetical protein
MPNEVTGTRVRRISFVRRAATRRDSAPSEPARVLLWKSEGASDAMPATPYVETATDREARRLSKACDVMHDEIETMRGDGTPTAVIQAHEKAYGRLHTKLVALHDPAAARLLRGETDNDKSERTTEMPTDLHKRAIGADDGKPGHGLLTMQEIEDRQERMAPLLNDLHDDIRRMHRTPETPPHVLERHERAHRALGTEYQALDQQRGLHEAAVAQSVRGGEPSVLAKADQLRKSDHTLSAAEAFRQAMRDPQVLDEYFAQSGTARPVPPTRHGLAKAAGDTFAEHGASVDARASALERSGLSPTAAYRKALSESGVLAAA